MNRTKAWHTRLRRVERLLAAIEDLPGFELRLGDLRRLPAGYQGERHVIVAKHLPDRNGQKWVEFEEVPGPGPVDAPEPLMKQWMDICFVAPYTDPEDDESV